MDYQHTQCDKQNCALYIAIMSKCQNIEDPLKSSRHNPRVWKGMVCSC
jgi:hypothetical protein